MNQRREAWDVVDPLEQQALAMLEELSACSKPNQARTLMLLRRRNPKLLQAIVNVMGRPLPPPPPPPAEPEGTTHGLPQ